MNRINSRNVSMMATIFEENPGREFSYGDIWNEFAARDMSLSSVEWLALRNYMKEQSTIFRVTGAKTRARYSMIGPRPDNI